jgi:hypothetical protein
MIARFAAESRARMRSIDPVTLRSLVRRHSAWMVAAALAARGCAGGGGSGSGGEFSA